MSGNVVNVRKSVSSDSAQPIKMEICDGTSKDTILKRHIVDEEGFQFPLNPLKNAASQPVIAPPVITTNKFGMLTVDLDNTGPSTSSAVPECTEKKLRMPPIVVSAKSVNNDLISKLKMVIDKDVDFEYTRRGLKVRTSSSADYRNTEDTLQKCKIEYFTLNPKSGNFVKYVLTTTSVD